MIMLSKSVAALVAAASASMAMTPSGFQPASDNDLVVVFGDVTAMNGVAVPRDATQVAPILATRTPLSGTSYAMIMVDLDANSTLLHWMQTGLTLSQTGVAMHTTGDSGEVFMLQGNGTAALRSYTGPSPPARAPLSHRYTQILVDTSTATAADVAVLQQAAKTTSGFSTLQVLTKANMATRVVAGNWFNVTNTGPATNAVPSPGGTSPSASSAPSTGPSWVPKGTTAPSLSPAVVVVVNPAPAFAPRPASTTPLGTTPNPASPPNQPLPPPRPPAPPGPAIYGVPTAPGLPPVQPAQPASVYGIPMPPGPPGGGLGLVVAATGNEAKNETGGALHGRKRPIAAGAATEPSLRGLVLALLAVGLVFMAL